MSYNPWKVCSLVLGYVLSGYHGRLTLPKHTIYCEIVMQVFRESMSSALLQALLDQLTRSRALLEPVSGTGTSWHSSSEACIEPHALRHTYSISCVMEQISFEECAGSISPPSYCFLDSLADCQGGHLLGFGGRGYGHRRHLRGRRRLGDQGLNLRCLFSVGLRSGSKYSHVAEIRLDPVMILSSHWSLVSSYFRVHPSRVPLQRTAHR